MQDRHIICYESRKSSKHEINYLTHDLELDVIVHTLKMWRHYLLGRRLIFLVIDHSGIWYLFE
jgi:hypothetical protein